MSAKSIDLNANLMIDPLCPAAAYWGGPKQLKFYYFPAVEFQSSVQATWARQEILGRSEGYLTYTGTANREFTVNTAFVLGMDMTSHGTGSAEAEEIGPDWLRACALPFYKNRILIPPPTLYFTVGEEFRSVRGVIINVDVQKKAPWTEQGRSIYREVTFTYVVVNKSPIGFNHILGKSGIF